MATKRQSNALAKTVVAKISKLSLKPDEVLIIRLSAEDVDYSLMDNLRKQVRQAWPQFANRIAMFAGDIELSKVKFADIGIDVKKEGSNAVTQEGSEGQQS